MLLGVFVVLGGFDELESSDESGASEEVDSDEVCDTIAVETEVDSNERTSGKSAVTVADVNAVVLPNTSTSAVTSTTTSAPEFVLMSEAAAVPCRRNR